MEICIQVSFNKSFVALIFFCTHKQSTHHHNDISKTLICKEHLILLFVGCSEPKKCT